MRRPILISVCSLSLGAGLASLIALAAPDSLATSLAVPGRANANVSLASTGRVVTAVWSAASRDGATDIMSATSQDGGETFGPRVRVNDTPGDARVNGEQPPRVVVTSRGSGLPQVTVIWTSKGGTLNSGTVLRTARSIDGGKTFQASTLVPGTDAAGNRGWEGLGADAGGRVRAVWLDHRRMAAPDAARTAAAHQHVHGESGAAPTAAGKPDGVAMAQKSDLYFDALDDAAPPRPITAGVCYCCKTALAFANTDDVYLAWRHVYPGNFRDIAFVRSKDGGRTFAPPVRVSSDNWMLEGCPDDGPTMAVDRAGRIHIVWPAVVSDGAAPVKALFHAVSTDGEHFSPRRRLPSEGQANHPQLTVAPDGSLVAAWDESGGGSRRIVWGRGAVDPSGQVSFSRSVLNRAAGAYPVVAPTSSGAILAWTSGAPDASVISLARVP